MIDRFETFSTTISFINRCIQKIKANEMASIGMKGTQAMCLYSLGKANEGLTASQLCLRCREDKGAISRTIKELEDLGYVSFSENTGKRAYRTKLVLTEKGRKALGFIDERVNKVLDRVGGDMKEDERKAFYDSLEYIADNLKLYVQEMAEHV